MRANVSSLLTEAEMIYAQAIVIDMLVLEPPMDAGGTKTVQASGVTCISPTIGVRWPANDQGSYMLRNFPFAAAVEDCVRWSNVISNNKDHLVPALRTDDILRAKREGKAAVMLNFQNATHIKDDLDNLNIFHAMGVRSIQLTYNERNLLGDGCTERTDAGLSDFGVAAVHRMNELGILVDTSHSGFRTTLDAIECSRQPPIFSHANCAALNPHPRNKSDEQIRALAAKGGVLGLTTANTLIKADLPVTLEHFLDHVDHIVQLVGIDHVACGSDSPISGWPTDPSIERDFMSKFAPSHYKPSYRFRYPLATDGINDPRRWVYVAEGMLRRGYDHDEITKFLGENWRRVFSQVIG
jgi:membrane dipeptidase